MSLGGFGGAFGAEGKARLDAAIARIGGIITNDAEAARARGDGAEFVVGGDLGFLLNIEGRLRRAGDETTRVLHVAQVLAAFAVVSMFLGAVAAIGQRDIKRLMAYSSIAHMGYALVGLAAATPQGVQATLIYMAIYVTMNLGTFAFILSMERDGRPVTDIGSLNQFARAEPLKAMAMLVLLFSLAGVPPMLGFFGKFYVLKAAVDAGLVWLAIAGAVASVIGAFYYLRIVYFMYFGAEQDPVESRMSPVQWLMLVGVAAAMLIGVVNLFGIEPIALHAAEALLG